MVVNRPNWLLFRSGFRNRKAFSWKERHPLGPAPVAETFGVGERVLSVSTHAIFLSSCRGVSANNSRHGPHARFSQFPVAPSLSAQGR